MTNINEYALVSGHPRDAKKRSPLLELAAYEKFLREIAQIQITLEMPKKPQQLFDSVWLYTLLF